VGRRLSLAAVTLAFVAAGAAFAFATPAFQAPDEAQHVDMVRHYARHLTDIPDARIRIRNGTEQAVLRIGLPQGGPVVWPRPLTSRHSFPSLGGYPAAEANATNCHFGSWTSCQNYHYAHPPTFYVLMSFPDRLLNHHSFPVEVLGLRLLCVLMAAPIVPLTWYAARQVWPNSELLPLGAAAAIATFAPLVADLGTVNNDALLLLCAAAMIAAAARLLRRPGPGPALALGIATGAGLASKAEFLALAPIAAVVVAVSIVATRGRNWLAQVLRFGVPVFVGSYWWLRNLAKYHHLQVPGGEILQPVRAGPWNGTSFPGYALKHTGDLLGRFWGLYGQSSVDVPLAWRRALAATVIVLALGWLVARRWRRPSAAGLRMSVLTLFPVILVIGAVHASYSVYRSNGEVRGLLGRYAYPSLPLLAIALVAAVAAIARRLRLRGIGTFVAGLAVLAALELASFARAGHGLYATSHLGLLLDRAKTVLASSTPIPWIAVLGVVWLASLVAAGVGAARIVPPTNVVVVPEESVESGPEAALASTSHP
jgi:hypothetical protein